VVKIRHIIHFLLKIFSIILFFFGSIFLVSIILAFTTAPFWIWYGFSTKYAGINRPPEYIIVLGGGGMPSESGLIRCWYATKTASHFPNARVIISLPGDTTDSLSSVNLMKNEMIIRGVDKDRIILEAVGTNTRAQSLWVKKMIEGLKESSKYEVRSTNLPSHPLTLAPSILIVTSPEHLTRAVLTFKKAGFRRVDGVAAFEMTIESDITFNDRILGGREWIPGVGGNLALRYQFWTQMKYEGMMFREFLAMVYYKLKGWI
jgi:uncharacterized SAM-binding protein YcdF (DUF218 family)